MVVGSPRLWPDPWETQRCRFQHPDWLRVDSPEARHSNSPRGGGGKHSCLQEKAWQLSGPENGPESTSSPFSKTKTHWLERPECP